MSTEAAVAAVTAASTITATLLGIWAKGFMDRRNERRTRGEQAAEAVLDALIKVDLGPFSSWRHFARRRKNPGTASDPSDPLSPQPSQANLEPYVVRIRRHGLVIDNGNAQKAARLAADNLYEYQLLCLATSQPSRKVWWRIHTEAESILGAYLRGDRVPKPKDLIALKQERDDWIKAANAGRPK